MASNPPPSYDSSDEDYIDMDLFPSSTHSSPPQNSQQFEFQLCFIPKETSDSPADELFYKGNLLPLHLSPRICMLQKLLLQTSKPDEGLEEEEKEGIELSNLIHCDDHPKKSWSKKLRLKLVKNSTLSLKLKAYMRSLFGTNDESSCAKASSCNVGPKNLRRLSFSEARKDKCLSSSSSSNSWSSGFSLSSSAPCNSNGFNEFNCFIKRSKSASEIEGLIEAAIAHCKM